MGRRGCPRPSMMATSSSIKCPHCAYDLSGTEGSRCPECGGVFDRDALLQADPGARFFLRGVQYPVSAILAAILGFLGFVGLSVQSSASTPIANRILQLLMILPMVASIFLAERGTRRGALFIQVISVIIITLLSVVYFTSLALIITDAIRR